MITQKDLAILETIYYHRCLSRDQIFRAMNKSITSSADSYFRQRLSLLLKDGLVEKVKADSASPIPYVYFLTTKGMNVLRGRHYLPTGGSDKYDLPAHKLRIKDSFIPHQYYLNSFAINTMKLLSGIEGVSYTDERHMRISEFVRPDGLIIIPEKEVMINGSVRTIPKTILYLECDMGTEARHTVNDKFLRYRSHLESSASDVDVRHIILFFCKDDQLSSRDVTYGIVPKGYEESSDMKHRVIVLKREILDAVGDKLKGNIEVIIGTQPRVLANLKLKYLSEYFCVDPSSLFTHLDQVLQSSQKNLDVKDVSRLTKFTNGVPYDAYAKSDTYQKSFIFMDYYDANMSVLHKILFHHANTRAFRDVMQRDLILVVVLNRRESIHHIKKLCDLAHYEYEDILFVLADDLKLKPFHECVFKVASYGFAKFNETMSEAIPLKGLPWV